MNLLRDRYLDAATRTTLRGVEFMPKGALEGSLGGTRRSTRHGFAVEFAGHREYVPGDDSRHIDWRTYHRSGRLYTKQYQEETNLHVYLLLDMSRSMQYPLAGEDQTDVVTKQLFAARLALALAYVAVAKRDAVSLLTFPQTSPHVPRLGSSLRTLYRMVDQIERHPAPTPEPAFSQSLEELSRLAASGHLGRRGMIIVISDFLDETDPELESLQTNLRNLQRSRHELMLFHVLHPDEYDFAAFAKRLQGSKRFKDLEQGRKLLANARELQTAYTEQLHRYLDRIESISRTLGIKYIFARSDASPGPLIRGALRSQRQILGHSHQ